MGLDDLTEPGCSSDASIIGHTTPTLSDSSLYAKHNEKQN